MIYDDKNFTIITKDLYEKVLNEDDNFYPYHYILVKYQDNKGIKTIEINQVKDLYKIKELNVLCKYYIKKLHFYTETGNYLYEYGEPYYIFNVGYFYIGGVIKTKKDELMKIKEMFEKYNKEYSKMKFSFDDKSF